MDEYFYLKCRFKFYSRVINSKKRSYYVRYMFKQQLLLKIRRFKQFYIVTNCRPS